MKYDFLHQSVSARISELKNCGLLVETGEYRLTRNGHDACVLIASSLNNYKEK